MEREEAKKIAKQAYKEVNEAIEETLGILEEIHGIDITLDSPIYLGISRYHFSIRELEE